MRPNLYLRWHLYVFFPLFYSLNNSKTGPLVLLEEQLCLNFQVLTPLTRSNFLWYGTDQFGYVLQLIRANFISISHSRSLYHSHLISWRSYNEELDWTNACTNSINFIHCEGAQADECYLTLIEFQVSRQAKLTMENLLKGLKPFESTSSVIYLITSSPRAELIIKSFDFSLIASLIDS